MHVKVLEFGLDPFKAMTRQIRICVCLHFIRFGSLITFQCLRLIYSLWHAQVIRADRNQSEYEQKRIESDEVSHYARELARERASREKVAADLKALVHFEAGLTKIVHRR